VCVWCVCWCVCVCVCVVCGVYVYVWCVCVVCVCLWYVCVCVVCVVCVCVCVVCVWCVGLCVCVCVKQATESLTVSRDQGSLSNCTLLRQEHWLTSTLIVYLLANVDRHFQAAMLERSFLFQCVCVGKGFVRMFSRDSPLSSLAFKLVYVFLTLLNLDLVPRLLPWLCLRIYPLNLQVKWRKFTRHMSS